MRSTTITRLLDITRHFLGLLQKFAGSFIRWLPGANWLQILVICVPIAFLVTILPLVILLFAVFFILKLCLVGSNVPPLTNSSTATSGQSATSEIGTNPDLRVEQ